MIFYVSFAFLFLVAMFFFFGYCKAKNHYKSCTTFLLGRCINTDCLNCTIYDGEEQNAKPTK